MVSVIITSLCVVNIAYGDNYKGFPSADVSLVDIAYNGKSVYVAVGSKGEIETSNDGIHLETTNSLGIDEDLTKVKWTGKEFIVLGKSGDILISEDGYKWHKAAKISSVAAKLNNVIWDKNCIVVVGDNGTIYISKDGKTFKLAKSNTKQSLNDVIRTNSLFVAVGNKGTIITSKDGIKWTTVKSGVTNNLKDVSWNGKKYVTVGGNAVLSSTDTRKWVKKYFEAKDNLTCIAWNKSGFMIVGTGVKEIDYYDKSNLITLTSRDALKWNESVTHDYPYTGEETELTQGPMEIFDLIWTGKQFVLVCYSDYYVRFDSPVFEHNSCIEVYEGNAWKPIEPSHEGYLEIMRKAMWDGKNLIVVGDTLIKYLNKNYTSYVRKGESSVNGDPLTGYNGKEYIDYSHNLTSNDGEYWYHDDKIGSDCVITHDQRIVWTGKVDVAISEDYTIVYSYDGLHWKQANTGNIKMNTGIEVSNGKFIVKSFDDIQYVSDDGINWTKQ